MIIRMINVAKIYYLGKVMVEALKNVNLEIEEGEFTVILGPSGSGKTTLLNVIGGIDRVTSGTIIVDGLDITRMSKKELIEYRRSKVDFIFQFFNLIPTLTAKENVELVTELSEKPRNPIEVLKEVGLEDRINHFPDELSGGQQQRVAIARALVKNSPIILCDEPTGELDFETGQKILALLRKINKKERKTILLVTHNSAIAEMADKVVRLRSGKIAEIRINENPIEPEMVSW